MRLTLTILIALLMPSLFLLPATKAQNLRRLTADRTLYVDCRHGNDANDGLTPPTAFKTAAYAQSYAWSNYFLDGWSLIVQLMDGDHRPCGGSVAASSLVTGQMTFNRNTMVPPSDAMVIFQGNPAGPTNVIMQGFYVDNGAAIWIKDITLITPGDAIQVNYNGLVSFKNVNFGNAGNCHLNAVNGGYISAYGSYAIGGNAFAHACATVDGRVQLPGFVVPVVGGPTFATCAFADNGGKILSGALWSGGANGTKFYGAMNSTIYGGNAMPCLLPGSVFTGAQAN